MNLRNLIYPLVVAVFFSACGEEKEEPAPNPDPVVAEISACNVSEGQEVDPADVPEIRITYNTTVALNSADRITLNGSRLTATVSDSRTVVLPVNLQEGTAYRLVVPAHAVIADNGASYGPALDISFTTITREPAPVVPPAFGPLVNSNATAQAKAVYNFLIEQYGKKIVSGAMANVNNNNDFADWVYRVTGKYPALTGYDFIHISESWIDYSNITPARTQWNNNGLVTYMWHINAPNSEEDYRSSNTAKYGFYIPGKGNAATEFDIREALKEGTWQNEFLLSDIDKVAGVLRLLQDEGIPVLWRPLHEAAGDYRYGPWFWWGRYGDEYVKKLWILLYERLVEHHGLNNLIWVWTAQCEQGYESQMAASYPGDEYVDIVGVDLYPDNDDSQAASYKAALDMTGGHKLVSLSEVGRIPSPQKCMDDGAYWAWFMEWYTYNIDNNAGEDSFGNTRDAWKQVMASPFVITREQMPNLRN